MNLLKKVLKVLIRPHTIIPKIQLCLENWFHNQTKEYLGVKMVSNHHKIRNRNEYPLREETEMLKFIDKIPADKLFWDVGANVGFFSLYAASKGVNTIAFEPDALTIPLVNKNIYLNGFANRIIAMPIALHDENKCSVFYMKRFLPANAYNTFDRKINHRGGALEIEFQQGSVGMKGDEFQLDEKKFSQIPYAVKIDVDGNELNVLKGMSETLKKVKLLCVELGYDNPEFEESMKIIKNAGLTEIKDKEFFVEKRHNAGMRNIYFEHVK